MAQGLYPRLEIGSPARLRATRKDWPSSTPGRHRSSHRASSLSPLTYLETNWIIGAVLGQDPRADELLASILLHSKSQPAAPRAFVTGNVHDFDVEPVRTVLQQHGVKFLSSTEHLLRWRAATRDSA